MSVERNTRVFWHVSDDGDVRDVKGYECPQHSQLWWVPTLGYSLWEGKHIFKSRDAAIEAKLAELVETVARLRAAKEQNKSEGIA